MRINCNAEKSLLLIPPLVRDMILKHTLKGVIVRIQYL